MATIVLIACVSKKRRSRARAKDLYQGPLFVNSLAYARLLVPDAIYILSAKYGVVGLEQEIEPYDTTLAYVSPKKQQEKPCLKVLTAEEKLAWASLVKTQLAAKASLAADRFVFLAGKEYVNPIRTAIGHLDEPLGGLPYIPRVQYLKTLIATEGQLQGVVKSRDYRIN